MVGRMTSSRLHFRNTTVLLVSLPIRSGGLTSERFGSWGCLACKIYYTQGDTPPLHLTGSWANTSVDCIQQVTSLSP